MLEEQKIYILFDCPDEQNDKKWLIDEISKIYQKVYSVSINKTLSVLLRQGIKGRMETHWIMLNQAYRVLKLSKENDLIICWNQTEGLYTNLLSILKGNKRKLILMNWLTPQSSKRRKKLLTSAAANPRVKIIVNSPESPEKWRKALNLSSCDNFQVVPDVYDSSIPFSVIESKEQKYCFTGGMNNRNWKMLMEMAKTLEDIQFVCVTLKDDFTRQVTDIPENVKVYYDTPASQYYELMKNAYLILLPLLDDRVAGLINILRAAQYGVPCMITYTYATAQYYGKSSEKLLMTDNLSEWIENIRAWYLYDVDTYRIETEKFCDFIKCEFSPEQAAKRIVWGM